MASTAISRQMAAACHVSSLLGIRVTMRGAGALPRWRLAGLLFPCNVAGEKRIVVARREDRWREEEGCNGAPQWCWSATQCGGPAGRHCLGLVLRQKQVIAIGPLRKQRWPPSWLVKGSGA